MSRPADNILGTLPVPKLVWTMSAPIMLSMLMSAIYNLVDSIYVAQVSELDFLALSYAYPVQLMMVAFCAGTGVGFNALFAQRLGAGQRRRPTGWPVTAFCFMGCAGCCSWPSPCWLRPSFPPVHRQRGGGGGGDLLSAHLLRPVHRDVYAVPHRAPAPDHRPPR